MPKLHGIPYEITDQIYSTLCEFGCARWKALLKYAEALVIGSDAFSEEYKEEHSEQLGEKALHLLSNENRLQIGKYADEKVALPIGRQDISFDSLNAFEAYAAITMEIAENGLFPEFCYARKTSDYPFHYVFAASKQNTLYRVLVYGHDAFVRIGYFNDSFSSKRDGRFVTLLVIPENYSWEEFQDVLVKGRTRIAFIREVNSKRKKYECLLTDIIEEPDAD